MQPREQSPVLNILPVQKVTLNWNSSLERNPLCFPSQGVSLKDLGQGKSLGGYNLGCLDYLTKEFIYWKKLIST